MEFLPSSASSLSFTLMEIVEGLELDIYRHMPPVTGNFGFLFLTGGEHIQFKTLLLQQSDISLGSTFQRSCHYHIIRWQSKLSTDAFSAISSQSDTDRKRRMCGSKLMILFGSLTSIRSCKACRPLGSLLIFLRVLP